MGLGHNINDGQRTQDIKISQDITFDTMLLKSNTLKGLKESGFYKPSPIQLHGIPLGKCGFDLLLEAKSGTGKTAVFTVIALEKIELDKGLQVLILAPTREIAMQIHDVVKEIGSKFRGLQVEVVMGGLSVHDDIEKFKKPVHVAVGSPGRLKHLIRDKYINTSAVRLLVLDEADKLMEKTFQSDIQYINSSLPQQKQIIMSSATYPENSKPFIQDYVQNAQHICPDSNNVLLGIEQKIILVKHNSNVVKQTQNKFEELLKILSHKQFKQGLIFCNYQARVGEVHKMLSKRRWPAQQLYGLQEQQNRLDALKILQEYRCRLLISTDLAARGIDASNIDLVINFEPPYEWQTYLHRIGRAGRFGSYGTAVTIISEGAEENKFKTLLESIKHPFELTNFWSNDKFSLKLAENVVEQCSSTEYENHTQCQENVSINDNVSELWAALTNDVKLKKPVENFDNLCEDSNGQETDGEIEAFDDLLKSFQSKKRIISEENEFVKMELLELSVNESNTGTLKFCRNINNNCLKSLEIQNSKKESGTTSLNQENLIENSDPNQRVQKIINHVDSNISCHNEKVENNFVDNSKLLVIVNKENAQIDGNDINTGSEDDTMNKTLQDLGLPTSFSSSKRSHNNQNKINTGKNNPNLLDYENTDSQRNNKKPVKSSKKKSKDKEECKIDIEPYHAKKSFRKHKKSSADKMEINGPLKFQTVDNVYNNQKISTNKEYLNNGNKTIRQKEHNKENYINWYNSLKIRMKEIERFVYLNEMNKF